MRIIYTALLLFIITTIMGLYLSSCVFRNKQTSKVMIFIHGVITIIGFVLLINYCPGSLTSILYLAIATLCGLILLYQDLTGMKFTKWLCYAHGILTLIGIVFLFQLTSQ